MTEQNTPIADTGQPFIKIYQEDIVRFGFCLKLMIYSVIRSYCENNETHKFSQSTKWLCQFLHYSNEKYICLAIKELVEEGFIHQKLDYSCGCIRRYSYTTYQKSVVNDLPKDSRDLPKVSRKQKEPLSLSFPPLTPIINTNPAKNGYKNQDLRSIPPSPQDSKKVRKNGTKGQRLTALTGRNENEKFIPLYDNDTEEERNHFSTLWFAYPKAQRFNADTCYKLWLDYDEVNKKHAINGLPYLMKTDRWITQGGRFIPYLETYLQDMTWTSVPDEEFERIEEEQKPPSQKQAEREKLLDDCKSLFNEFFEEPKKKETKMSPEEQQKILEEARQAGII